MSAVEKFITIVMRWVFMVIFGSMTLAVFLWQILIKGPKQMFYVKKREERPEVLDDPDLGIHKFARLKNVRLHYVESGSEDKPLMLFIHGFPEFWYSWRHQIREFSKDFRVVAMDMRGYSESEKPSGVKSYLMEKLVEDVQQLIQFLGHEKAILVAHDWGGGVAWSFAVRHPEMVAKIIVCNCPMMAAMQKLAKESFKQVLRSWYMFMFQWPILPELLLRAQDLKFVADALAGKRGCKPGRITPDDIEAYKFTFQHFDSMTCPINYYRAALGYPNTDPRFKGRVTVPALMIWGTADMALGKELAEMTRNYCDDYRINYVEGASHWVQQDEPEAVNKHIRDFVSDSVQE